MDNNKEGQKSQEQSCGFVLIPASIMNNKKLTLTQKIVFGRIFGLVVNNKGGCCYASNYWLGKQLGISERAVRKHVRNLIELGLLKRRLVQGNGNGFYKRELYLTEEAMVGVGTKVPGGRNKSSGGVGTKVPQRGEGRGSFSNSNREFKKEKENSWRDNPKNFILPKSFSELYNKVFINRGVKR